MLIKKKRTLKKHIWHFILVALVAVLPGFLRGSYSYLISLMVMAGIYVILVLGLNLLLGYAGQISLGHAAFYGIGAYSSAIVTMKCSISPWLGFLAAIVITCAIALLIGIPTLRLRGHYLAMATLGIGIIFNKVMVAWDSFTGGPDGIYGIPTLNIGSFAIDSDVKQYYFVWLVTILVFTLSYNIVNSGVGRALKAIKSNETASGVLGINAARYKLLIFVLSAAFASIAGSLYTHCRLFINPQIFSFILSIKLVTMVVIGGMANVWGGLIGALILTFLPEFLTVISEHWRYVNSTELEIAVYGLTLVLVLIFAPEGFAGRMVKVNFLKKLNRYTS